MTFYTRWIRIDITALLVMLALMLPWRPDGEGGLQGLLSPAQGLSGFGSPAVIMLASMFVLSAAMVRTGAAPMIGERILAAGSGSLLSLQVTVFVTVAIFSSVVSNTTTVLIGMPLVLRICHLKGYPPSKILMPLAFASLLGGQWTLIGTRSNIILSDYLDAHTGQGLSFFAFTPIAAATLLASVAFFVLVGRRLLPERAVEPTLAERYEVTEYLTEVMAQPGSEMVGRTLAELGLSDRFEVNILQVIRGEEYRPPAPWLKVQSGDVFVIQGSITKITSLLEKAGVTFKEELALRDKTLRSVDLLMIEAVVAPHSDLEGHSLEDVDFQSRYGVSVLAIGRRGQVLQGRPQAQKLRFGDSLLLVAHQAQVDSLHKDPNLVLADRRRMPFGGKRKAFLVLGLIALIAVGSASGWLDPAFVIPLAAVLAVLTGCVSARESYESIDWQTLCVVGGMLPFGLALEVTGNAESLADLVSTSFSGLGPTALFAAVTLLVLLMTQLIGNAAVAIIVAPVAYNLAIAVGAEPMPFLLGSAICASASFMTPVAHEATILVMGPGDYEFKDYTRLGLPMGLITWVVTVLVLPMLYPLTAT